MSDWYVYMVRCRDGSLYTGITTDVLRRLAEHQENGNAGAKYLRGRGPLTLVLQKSIGSRSMALSVERKVKKLPKIKKEELLQDDTYIEKIILETGDGITYDSD